MEKELTLEEKYMKTLHLLQCLLRNGYIGLECFNEKWYEDQTVWIQELLEELNPYLVEQARREASDFKIHNTAYENIKKGFR